MIKRLMLKRIFNWILILMLILSISWSYYSYISAKSNVSTFDATSAILSGMISEEGPINAIKFIFDDLFNLAMLQVLTFLSSTIALIFLLWFIFKLYLVAETNALVDPLTEIYNRRAIMLGLKSEIERSKRFNHHLSVAIVDIDYFKKYNDQNGHVAGDVVLKKVARILDKSIRATDIIGRIGGEEFLIIFPETKKLEAAKICERMREKLESADFPNEKSLPRGRLTVSVGIGEFNESFHKHNKEKLIQEADKQLYLAKLSGRNRVK